MAGKGQHRRSASMIMIALLAVAQGLFGLMRTAGWVEIGRDLSQRGVLMWIIGMMVFGRGILVAVIAVLYGVFAWGLLTERGWARRLGLAVAVMNLILAAGLVLGDSEFTAQALLWMIVPVVIVGYLLGAGRPALARTSA